MLDFQNKNVVITRPRERSGALARLVEQYNGIPIIVPTLELTLVQSLDLLYIADNIDDFEWLIFTSPAGVKSFFNVYQNDVIPSKVAVIGTKTSQELAKHNIKADLLPSDFTAEGLLESFKNIDIKDKKIGLPRTLKARNVLPEGLTNLGAEVIIAEAYKSQVPEDKSEILNLIDQILENKIDFITFTSPLTFQNLIDVVKLERLSIYDKFLDCLRSDKITVVSIGPVTNKVINKYDITTFSPKRYTVKDMIEELLKNIN